MPDFAKVQGELAQLNKTTGRQVMPLVREGQRPGTMDVDLQVEDQNPWSASVGLNNDYSADTEKLRAVTSLGYNNLWQLGHSINLTYFTAPQDTDSAKVWSGAYTAPMHRICSSPGSWATTRSWAWACRGFSARLVLLQFGDLLAVRDGRIVDTWPVYS